MDMIYTDFAKAFDKYCNSALNFPNLAFTPLFLTGWHRIWITDVIMLK